MTLEIRQAELVNEPFGEEANSLTLESGPEGAGISDPAQPAPTTEEGLAGNDIPEQYRNKTARELLDIIRNKDDLYGRQSNELGELRGQVGTLRGVVDQAIALQSRPNAAAPEAEAELTADDLLNNPADAIGRGVGKAIKPIEDRLSALDERERRAEFVSRHKTATEDVNDPAFIEFVQKSPYRTRLATKAFQNVDRIDYEAAEELWLAYEDVRGTQEAAAAPSSEPTTPKSTPSASEVALVASGGSGASPSSDKTIYSANALVQLQMNDPDKYYDEAFYTKIAQAYAEGRVK